MNADFINCGERRVQQLKRISLKDVLDDYEIEVGSKIEVFIRKIQR